MVKDRIGNVLHKGDRLLVALPESQIFGFVAELKEQGVIRGVRGGAETTPGAVLVSCVIALPIDYQSGQVVQCVKVYDPDKHEDPEMLREKLN
jgi:hypothetical protein